MGGTYLAQVTAENANQAVIVWAEQLEVKDIPNLGPKSKADLIKDLQCNQDEGSGPIPINGLINVWFDSLIVRGKSMLLDVFKTDEN